ncbi:uncharacterized protein LOC142634590 [Castanea sativa]|uniref:uncharacterized protein LOC142634590 n=1 Tax=Castanea sativa TaxID=21020 RepID=UPI003F64D96F
MADEVIDGLENMKLTTKEEEVITISDEGRVEAIEDCTRSLMGKVLMCKSFNKRVAKNTMRRAWGLEDSLCMTEVGPNLFQFKFTLEFDLNRLLQGGLWFFDNQLLMLKRRMKGMTVGNIRMETATLWIQIWGAPLDMFSSHIAKEVGSKLGVVKEVGQRKGQDELNYLMRVQVALPISKPIRRGSFIAGFDGDRHWVTFKYEQLPLFCHYCGMLGHDVKNCAAHFAVTKNGGKTDYQYGEFLKEMGGRPRVDPYTEKQEGLENSSEGGGGKSDAGFCGSEDGQFRFEAWLHQNKAVTVERRQCRNPSNDEDGESEFSGNTPQSQERDRKDLAHADYVVRCTADVYNSVSDLKEISVQKDNVLTSGLDGKASVSQVLGLSVSGGSKEVTSAGPNATKPKSSWARFNRMDFGLEGLQKFFIGFYGWPEAQHKEKSWKLIEHLKSFVNGAWLCAGDFNAILNSAKKLSVRPPNLAEIDAFRSVLDSCNFEYLGYKGYTYTWSNKRPGEANTKLKLDRAVATMEWRAKFQMSIVSHLPPHASYHLLIMMHVKSVQRNQQKFKKGFKFEEAWLLWEDCGAVVKDAWDMVGGGESGLASINEKIKFYGEELQASFQIKAE